MRVFEYKNQAFVKGVFKVTNGGVLKPLLLILCASKLGKVELVTGPKSEMTKKNTQHGSASLC